MPTLMPTLPQAPLRRLAPLRRAPFWAQALAVCALFAIAGVAVVDDYGVAADEPYELRAAAAVADYIAAGGLSQRDDVVYLYYGMALKMPLLLIERALGLQDARHIYLTHHLIIHLFFIAGGFACGMLAYRMLGSRWIALLAMLMFMLHPRLYAHSFFNAKDIPFAAMLLIALYLAHRAFRRDAVGAFLLCGIGVGLAINLRPFGLMLPPMLLAMRALDLWQASGEERKRIAAAGGIFVAAALGTAYIIHPYYWENPLRFFEGLRALSQHPVIAGNLFMGEIYRSDAVPWNFIPVWFAITAPPVALLMGAIGCAAVCWQVSSRPLAALRCRETRFRILLLGCFALPVVIAIILQSNIYNGWRQMYFLWAPFCLLAAIGLHCIANLRMRGSAWKIGARLPGWVRGRLHRTRRALAYGATAVGLTTTLTAMAAMHPHQQVYFNALTDTKTPGALAERYNMDYWQVAQRQSLEYLLARYPNRDLRVYPKNRNERILPKNDRKRIVYARPDEADFYIKRSLNRWNGTDEPAIHGVRAYGSGIAHILAPNSAAYRDYYRAAYSDVEANGTLLASADFDVYAHNGALYYLSANCAPLLADLDLAVFLHITPADPADLPADRRELGFDNRDFLILRKGVSEGVFTPAVFFDGKCVIRQPLPDYPIARISTGQFVLGGDAAWRIDIDLAAHAAARALHGRIIAGDYGQPVARSDFDVYLRGDRLAYIKESCALGDAHAWIFLHIFPDDAADLPADRREYGFANMGFRFADHGARIGDICAAERELPGYAIARIRTGRNAAASGVAGWRADIDMDAHAAAQAAAQAMREGIAAGDYGAPVAQSHFDLYLNGNALTYIKDSCAPGDADARFFLHIIPADPADLPADERERGFANMDFHFADHGERIGDICVAERELPGYAIERVITGQFVSGEGRLWGAEFPVGR